jgi:septal ring factor EnvC (AmiA/AmiB activator)
VFFNSFRTNARVTQLETEVARLKQAFSQIEQDWDATTARVTKVLRRIRTAEVAQDREEQGDIVERLDASTPSTIPTPPGRLDRIRKQLEARGKNGGE